MKLSLTRSALQAHAPRDSFKFLARLAYCQYFAIFLWAASNMQFHAVFHNLQLNRGLYAVHLPAIQQPSVAETAGFS